MTNKTSYGVVLMTAASVGEARRIVKGLLKERLIACANIVPAVESHFVWKGKMCVEKEVLVMFKTKEGRFEELKKAILNMHSYEVPEIVLLPIRKGFEKYLRWMDEVIQ